MSKKPKARSAKKTGKTSPQNSSKLSRKLYFILPLEVGKEPSPDLVQYFSAAKQNISLILVSSKEYAFDSENIQTIQSGFAHVEDAWQAGFAKITDKNALISFLYPNREENILETTEWITSRNIANSKEVGLVGYQGKAKVLHKLVNEFWNPIDAEMPLANINVVSYGLAEQLTQKHLVLPIEQSRFILQQKEANIEAMKLPVTSKKSLVKEKFELFGLNFKLLWQDFVKSPIESIKSSNTLLSDLKDGNHPLFRLGFAAIFLFFLVLMPIISFDYGITWDEPLHVEYAEDAWNYYSTFGEDQMIFDEKGRRVRFATKFYGTAHDLFTHIIYTYFSPFGIYETRHLFNVLAGLLAAFFIGRAGRQFGTWRTGVIALLIAFLCPRFFGHSFNNHKDIPFLFGMAMATFYLLKFLSQLPKPRVSTSFWLAVGMSIAISVRIGGLLFFGYFGLFFGIAWLATFTKGAGKAFSVLPKYLAYGVLTCVLAYFLGISLWPYGMQAPLTNPFKALTQLSQFQLLLSYELFDGNRMLVTEPPASYLPKWLLISVPVVTIVGSVLSVFGNLSKKFNKPFFFALLFMLVFPIAYIIYKGSTVYSGWRQVLFVFAPMAVLAATGWDFVFYILKPKALKIISVGMFVVLLSLPAYWMVKNHPHQYVYFNELIGGINGAYTNYETEYWGNGAKEAVEWLAENGHLKSDKEKIVIATNLELTSSQYYANKYSDKVQILWCRENQLYHADWDYAIFASRTIPKEAIPSTYPPKGTIYTVKADSVPLVAVVKNENSALYESVQAGKKRDYNLALQKVQEYLKYSPNNLEAIKQEVLCYLSLGKSEETLRACQRAIDINPYDYGAYIYKGISLMREKKYQEGIDALNISTDLRINNFSAYRYKGSSYAALKKYVEAYKNFDLAIKYSGSKNADVFFDLGVVAINHGMQKSNVKDNRMKLAIKVFNKSLVIRPNDKRCYQNIAFAYSQLGDKANAEKYRKLYQQ